jgi:hypothetical protein
MHLNYSLDNHPSGYATSVGEKLLGLIVSPYAIRHAELSNSVKTPSEHRLGHRIIAAIQFIPLFGALASLIERIVVHVYNTFFKTEKVKETDLAKKPNDIKPLDKPVPSQAKVEIVSGEQGLTKEKRTPTQAKVEIVAQNQSPIKTENEDPLKALDAIEIFDDFNKSIECYAEEFGKVIAMPGADFLQISRKLVCAMVFANVLHIAYHKREKGITVKEIKDALRKKITPQQLEAIVSNMRQILKGLKSSETLNIDLNKKPVAFNAEIVNIGRVSYPKCPEAPVVELNLRGIDVWVADFIKT